MGHIKARCRCGGVLTFKGCCYLPTGEQVCEDCWEEITGKKVEHFQEEDEDEVWNRLTKKIKENAKEMERK